MWERHVGTLHHMVTLDNKRDYFIIYKEGNLILKALNN